MKLTRLFTMLVLGALASTAGKLPPSGLAVTCESGTAVDGHCLAGFVGFSGTGYPSHVRVVVTGGTSGPLDDSVFSAQGGNLNFTEQLDPADFYTVTVYDIRGKVDTIIDQFTVISE